MIWYVAFLHDLIAERARNLPKIFPCILDPLFFSGLVLVNCNEMPHHRIFVLPVCEAAVAFAYKVLLSHVLRFCHSRPLSAGILRLQLFEF